MKGNFLLSFAAVLLLFSGTLGVAHASFIVEQYDNYRLDRSKSVDVDWLKEHAANNLASTSTVWDIIDFTDDPMGSDGLMPGSNLWPSAFAAGVTGKDDRLNSNFFARITGNFFVGTEDTYTFRTFNDDGLFLFVNDLLTIDDPSFHAEKQFTGTQALSVGTHSIELYFFEYYGEATLELSIAAGNGPFTHFNVPEYQLPVPEPGTMLLLGLGLLGLSGINRRKK